MTRLSDSERSRLCKKIIAMASRARGVSYGEIFDKSWTETGLQIQYAIETLRRRGDIRMVGKKRWARYYAGRAYAVAVAAVAKTSSGKTAAKKTAAKKKTVRAKKK